MYVALIGRLIHNFGVTYHQYADDTQVYTKLEVPATSSLASLQQCVTALHAWFSQNALLLNTDKSKVIYFGPIQRLRVSKLPESVIIAGSTITTTDELKILDVVLDSSVIFHQHILNTVMDVSLLVVMIRLELCTTYSSNSPVVTLYLHHPLLQ